MTSSGTQNQYQVWLNHLCRNFIARIKSIPEVEMVTVQSANESGLPDFFVLLDDPSPDETSLARYRVTDAVLNLRWQYRNPWLLDYYFVNLEQYRDENPDVSWQQFLSPTETVIYAKHGQPFDLSGVKWAAVAAGMLGCAFICLLATVSNRTGSTNLFGEVQTLFYILPLLLLVGIIASFCVIHVFQKSNLWSNGEGVMSSWLEGLVQSGVIGGIAAGLAVTFPLLASTKIDFLTDFSYSLYDDTSHLAWNLPPPLNLLAFLNTGVLLTAFTGLLSGLIVSFCLALPSGWLVRRWVLAHPLASYHSDYRNQNRCRAKICFLANHHSLPLFCLLLPLAYGYI